MEAISGMTRRSSAFKSVVGFTIVIFVLSSVSPSAGIRCYQCGQYTDGVGSITPCINYTEALHLKECPHNNMKQCVKYVSEGSTVRDCSAKCTEKDAWGTKVYCCAEDGCNGSTRLTVSSLALLCATLVVQLRILAF